MNDGGPIGVSAVPGYRVEALIGRGGMGEVYRAMDEGLGRPVALKVLSDGLAFDERYRARLLEESRRAASLDHPNVVPVYEAGEAHGRLFLAMRYVTGTDLQALLRREGALEPARATAIAAQVADALDAAHRRGLVHRDVKPSNVLLDHAHGRDHAYLADFGLTQSMSDRGPADGQFMGTVDYVAPEQIRGDAVDGRADQYGLACLLFECLTASVPYRAASGVGALFAHLEEPVPLVGERRVGLPAELDGVFARALAKDPDERFASCTEFVDAARGALGIDVPVTRLSRVAVALVVALAAVTAAAVGFALRRDHGPPPPAPAGMLVRVNPRTNAVAGRTAVAGHPGNLAVTPGGVWMADFTEGVLWRQARAGGPVERVTSNGEPRDLAAMGGKVYVAVDGKALSGAVARYDAVTGIREDTLDQLTCAVASGEGVVWAAGCPAVQRLSTDGGKLRKLAETLIPYAIPATVENVRAQIREMAVGDGSLWVLGDARDRRMWRLDARTGKILATIPLAFPPRSVAVAGRAAWITDGLHDTAVPVDVETNRPGTPLRVGRGAAGIAAHGDTLWIADALDGTLTRVDAHRRRVAATVRVGGEPREVTVGDGEVWTAGDAR
jgi:DNA-binding beta-propeller fold protein YncE